jgi:citronellol/citronellal dehydrogenase
MPSRIFVTDLLAGQVALVTGGGSGLGRAAAAELAACGARVVVAGSGGAPEGCEAVECDLGAADQVDQMVDGVLERHGRIDTLVNGPERPAAEPGDVQAVLTAAWLPTHAVATRAMIPAGGGKIVNLVASPDRAAQPGVAHAAAVRAGIENLARVLSIEWARFGIRVNAIAVGPNAEGHGWLAAYLASPAGDFYSGALLAADG